MEGEEKGLQELRQDIIDNNLHVKAIIQVCFKCSVNRIAVDVAPVFPCFDESVQLYISIIDPEWPVLTATPAQIQLVLVFI